MCVLQQYIQAVVEEIVSLMMQVVVLLEHNISCKTLLNMKPLYFIASQQNSCLWTCAGVS